MNRNLKTEKVLNYGCIFVLFFILIGTLGCSQTGRYQLVGRDSGKPFVIDTTTGKRWTVGDGEQNKFKLELVLPGEIGRYKGIYTNSNLYIIDTAKGKAWTP